MAVALALQDTLTNFFAGLHILAAGPIKPGDYVKLDSGEEGYVVDITWRNTSIRALLDNMIIVPNSQMASCKIINYSLPGKEVFINIPIGVSYCCDLTKVEKITIQVAQDVMHNVAGGICGYQPIVRLYKFGDFSIQFRVLLRAREFADQYLIRHEFLKRLHQRYRAEGIEIPYPIQTVYLKKDDTGSDKFDIKSE
ncbi:Small-conductance mechanosensitive channel [bioreactor metagenome]|uniref:Small-conductance mechanosensitive channel n=1 Tax=bioreactor metagenome TaxID=1076179 RepID=A0A645G6V2_9ZZZZ